MSDLDLGKTDEEIHISHSVHKSKTEKVQTHASRLKVSARKETKR